MCSGSWAPARDKCKAPHVLAELKNYYQQGLYVCTYMCPYVHIYTHTLSECEGTHTRNLNIGHSYLWISLIEICEHMTYGRYAVSPGHLHVLD